MKHLFIPSELAIWVQELGFKEDCLGYYNQQGHSGKWEFSQEIWFYSTNYIEAPLYQQIIDWLRIQHKIVIELTCYETGWMTTLSILPKVEKYIFKQMGTEDYYEAMNIGIIKALQSLEKYQENGK